MAGVRKMANTEGSDLVTTKPTPETDKKATLLGVDDEELIQDLLARSLERFDYEIVTARNAVNALAALNFSNFELALID
jgi:DNA-binding NtrC family response regulator